MQQWALGRDIEQVIKISHVLTPRFKFLESEKNLLPVHILVAGTRRFVPQGLENSSGQHGIRADVADLSISSMSTF